MTRIEETISDTLRPSDSSVDKRGGWYRIHSEYTEVMSRAERELDWPATVQIKIVIDDSGLEE